LKDDARCIAVLCQYAEHLEYEGFQKNPLLKLDDVDPASVFQAAQHKLQHNISKAENTRLSRDLIEMMQLPVPGSGGACSFGARWQAIANLEKNTSGWLHANPAFFPNHKSRNLAQGVVAESLIGSDSTCSIATSVSVHL
jgi:hypothetical protein